MKEYKISKGWTIFLYLSTPIIIALFGWTFFITFSESAKNHVETTWFLRTISFGFISFFVLGFLDTVKGKLVIEKERIKYSSPIFYRELMFEEIKGYRLTKNYLIVEPIEKKKKKIRVSIAVGKFDKLVKWFAENYSNLDISEAIQEKVETLNNEIYGLSAEQREGKLILASKVAKILNWTGGLIGAWTLFLANLYEYAIISSVTLPIICLIAVKYFKGLIRIDERKHLVHPSIFIAIFFPSMALCLRGLVDYNIFDNSKIWTPSILITLTYTTVFIIGNNEFKFIKAKDYLLISILSIAMFCYSYGAVINLNCLYDKSEPEIFNATILSKRINSGKSTTYYLELAPWGQQKEADEVSVSKVLYNKLDQNDNVNIYFRKGQFNIPWFEVTEWKNNERITTPTKNWRFSG